eukprot:355262-Chlamydomonas_euryale.AAC.2
MTLFDNAHGIAWHCMTLFDNAHGTAWHCMTLFDSAHGTAWQCGATHMAVHDSSAQRNCALPRTPSSSLLYFTLDPSPCDRSQPLCSTPIPPRLHPHPASTPPPSRLDSTRCAVHKNNNYKGSIYMVFDYCEYDLTGLLETVKYKFTESQVCGACGVWGVDALGARLGR